MTPEPTSITRSAPDRLARLCSDQHRTLVGWNTFAATYGPSFTPGSTVVAFADHLYFSIAVSTTFGTTDIDLISPKVRRVVNFHTVLTVVYNSAIVALLVSPLVR